MSAGGFLKTGFLATGFLTNQGAAAAVDLGVGKGKRKSRRDPYALVREYSRSLMQAVPEIPLEWDTPQRTTAQEQPRKPRAASSKPQLTDAMARAASAEQLLTIMRSASAAVLDRQRAAEERRRRGLMAVLLLALD